MICVTKGDTRSLDSFGFQQLGLHRLSFSDSLGSPLGASLCQVMFRNLYQHYFLPTCSASSGAKPEACHLRNASAACLIAELPPGSLSEPALQR